MVKRYSGLGISGDRRVPVSEAVSHEYRVPEEVRVLGYEVITLYVVLCITHKEDRSPQLESFRNCKTRNHYLEGSHQRSGNCVVS